MTTRELFELAAMDVLGLLDEEERQSFEDAFRAAPAHVQAQIRAQQTRFASVDEMLPKVSPPPSLRARVLGTVREAISAVQAGPVATIGTGGRVRLGLNSAPIWRAACIGFATASLVLSGLFIQLTRVNRDMTAQISSNQIQQYLAQKAGAEFSSMLTRPTLRHVAFAPAAKDYLGKAGAALFVDTSTKTAYLVCEGLPLNTTGEFRLVIQRPGGDQTVANFPVNSGAFYVPIKDIDVGALSNLSIQMPGGDGRTASNLLVSSGV